MLHSQFVALIAPTFVALLCVVVRRGVLLGLLHGVLCGVLRCVALFAAVTCAVVLAS